MGWFSRFEDHCEAEANLDDYVAHRQDRNEHVETEEYERLQDQVDNTSSWWRS
jgi:hypothetical protein